jgi:citrate lyase subunit gamma (acyl carrier protein)
MKTIVRPAQAGTVESSDIQIILSPAAIDSGIQVDLVSPTLQQYGSQIKAVIVDTLTEYGITSASVHANDKGALDCTIKARVTTAAERATAGGTAK